VLEAREKEDLKRMGRAIADMAADLHKNGNIENALFIVPERGGGPIFQGLVRALGQMGHKEIHTVHLPASSIVENRDKNVREIVSKILKKNRGKYSKIYIIDEVVSGSSANMVRKAVVDAVKELDESKEWKRWYWQKLPVQVISLAAYNGEKIDGRIRKLATQGSFRFYKMHGRIPTMDREDLSPVQYPDVRRIVYSKRQKKTAKVVGPHILYDPQNRETWEAVKKAIEEGVLERLSEIGASIENKRKTH